MAAAVRSSAMTTGSSPRTGAEVPAFAPTPAIADTERRDRARRVFEYVPENVDAVVLFSEDTPLALIEALRPDILVKGADYTVDQVVGADVVRQAGGRVVLVDIVAGRSTTGTIARLRARGGE